jgi:glycosyltransferase involved in cell wall biosynthesis
MKIAILAPSGVPYAVGGAEKLWWGLLEGIRAHTDHEVELIKVPSPERNMREIIASYRYFSGLELNHFDLVVSTKYPAWMAWHWNHIVYLQHKLRGLYDTYPVPMPTTMTEWPESLGGLEKCLSADTTRENREPLFRELERLQAELEPQFWDEWFALPSPLARTIVHWLDDSALHPGTVRKFMAISNNVVQRSEYFPANMPVQVIHHPSDLEPAIGRDGDYLFTVSRLDKPKRLDLLIRGMLNSTAALPLLIAGAGPELSDLQKLAADDPRITFLGRIPDSELRNYYAGALAVAFVPEDEDYGLITVEAMQAGKPVLTCSDSGGSLELVEHGVNGWVVEPEVHSLAELIDRIDAERQEIAGMAAACQSAVAHINWPSTIARLLDDSGRVDVNGLLEAGKPNHIVVPLTFPIWPPHSGGQNRVFHLYSRIAQFTPVTLLTLCNYEEPGFDGEISPGLRELRIPKSKLHQQGERAAEQVLKTSISDLYAIEHMSETPAFMEALKLLCKDADLVVASHPYLYPAIREVYRGNMYYEAHNVELDMKRDILGDLEAVKPWLSLVDATEAACARESVGISVCSAEDGLRLRELYDLTDSSISVVPNGVELAAVPNIGLRSRLRAVERLGPRAAPAAVFMGSWHGPNIDAVAFIVEKLAPKLANMEFWVIGSVCHYDFGTLPGNIVFFGQLSDSDKNSVLSCARVAINPVATGSGSNLKMAEYIAAGLPVLSTPFGCRGLDIAGAAGVFQAEMGDFPENLQKVVNQSTDSALNAMSAHIHSAEGVGYDWQGSAMSLSEHMVMVCAKCSD